MKLLLLSQHYWPETVGTAGRIQLLAEHLVGKNISITVLCAWPNHPSMSHLFRDVNAGSQEHNGVVIHRVPIFRTPSVVPPDRLKLPFRVPIGGLFGKLTRKPVRYRKGITHIAKRLLTYASWTALGSYEALLSKEDYDAVIAVSPLPTGVLAAFMSRTTGIPLIFDVQDIWPDGVVKAGILRDGALIRALELLEAWVYRSCSRIIVLSDGFRSELIRKGVPAHRIRVIPNAARIAPRAPGTGAEALRRELNLSSADTLVIYTGNIGMVQDLDCLVEAAKALRTKENIHFLIVGDGVERERLEQKARRAELSRFRFMTHQPRERIPTLLAAADICFLSLKPEAYTPGTIPSKLYEYLANARAIINLVEGDAADWIDTAKAGINIAPGDVSALAVAIFSLHSSPDLRQQMGMNGRTHLEGHASINVVSDQYLAIVDDAIASVKKSEIQSYIK